MHFHRRKCTPIINGGAIRFDLITASLVLEMKKEYPQIKLILVLPYENHTEKWPNPDDIALYA